jgi:hypothetical protein
MTTLTESAKAALRQAIIAGAGDCILEPGEAAIVMGVSESWLRASDVPRAKVAGVKYLKSECLKYVAVRLSHRILEKMEKSA